MGEMEQLRQEAEQLKKQIAVTPEMSHMGIPENRNGEMKECGLGGGRLDSFLSHTLETPDLEMTGDFLDIMLGMSPNCRTPTHLPQRPRHPHPALCPSLP